jgi:hypothetical protein
MQCALICVRCLLGAETVSAQQSSLWSRLFHGFDWLSKLLPVLNGLICTTRRCPSLCLCRVSSPFHVFVCGLMTDMSAGLRDHLLEHYTLTPLTHVCQRLMASAALHALSGGGGSSSGARNPSPRSSLFVPTPPPPQASPLIANTISTGSAAEEVKQPPAVAVGAGRPSSRDSNKEDSGSEDAAQRSVTPLSSRPASAASTSSHTHSHSLSAAASTPSLVVASPPLAALPPTAVLRSRLLNALEFATNIIFNLTPHRPVVSNMSSTSLANSSASGGSGSGSISAGTMSPSLFSLFDTCELLVRRYCPAAISCAPDKRSAASISASNAASSAAASGSVTPRSSAQLLAASASSTSTSRVVSLPSISLTRNPTALAPPPTPLSPPASPTPAPVTDPLAELELECVHHRFTYSELTAVCELRLSWYGVLQPLLGLRTAVARTAAPTDVMARGAVPYATRLCHSSVLMCRLLQDCYIALGQCRPCPESAEDAEVAGAWTDGFDSWTLFAPALDLLLALCEVVLAESAAPASAAAGASQLHRRGTAAAGLTAARGKGASAGGNKTSRGAPPASHSLQLGDSTARVRAILLALVTWKPGGAADVLAARAQQVLRLAS